MNYTYDELVMNGGKPSGSTRSTYTSICTALAAYEKATPKKRKENYITAEGCALLDKLDGLIAEFIDRRHPSGSRMNDKKSEEVEAVTELRAAIVERDTVRKVSNLLNKYKTLSNHPHGGNSDVIRNSMLGWIDRLSRNVNEIVTSTDATLNASVKSNGEVHIHPGNFFKTKFKNLYERGEFFPVSILVHEYHHLLTKMTAKSVYADEFVAHWKQYDAMGVITAMGGKAACVAELNDWLLDNRSGYKRRHEIPPSPVFNGPEDTPASYWLDHIDNAR